MPSDVRAEHLWPSAEQGLLLDAALLDDDRAAVAAFRAWRRSISFNDEFSRGSYRLLPLVYHRMHQLAVDDPMMGRLKGVYRRAWYDTHRLFYKVRPVVAGLTAAGIEVMLIKGAPLALDGYAQVTLRPMADVDVVVPPERLGDVNRLLTASGWRPARPLDPDVVRFRHALTWYGPDGGEIDLHWRLLYESGPSDRDAVFAATARPLDFMGTPVVQPDPTHHLFLTVVHGLRWNEETPIRWIADAMTIVRAFGASVDWDRLPALAAAYRVSARLALGLDWLARRYDAPVPAWVLAHLRAAPLSLFERLENAVLLDGDTVRHPSALRNQWMWMLEYGRYAGSRAPLELAVGYTHFLRYRLELGGRRELVPLVLGGLRKRLARMGRAPSNSGGPMGERP